MLLHARLLTLIKRDNHNHYDNDDDDLKAFLDTKNVLSLLNLRFVVQLDIDLMVINVYLLCVYLLKFLNFLTCFLFF